MKEINNIADTTGRATYQSSPTKISPAMEQLYFEMEDKEHVFQIGKYVIIRICQQLYFSDTLFS
jgi:hypothetical protein